MGAAIYGVLAVVFVVAAVLVRKHAASLTGRDVATIPPWEPAHASRDAVPHFRRMHRKFLREIVKRQPDLVFIGDSITAEWLTTGYPFWKAAFEPRRAFNLGIPGDSTQGVLWRIENGELDGIKPRAVVLLIGTNNIPQHEAPDEIARGIVACVHAIRAKLPAADVVLLGILPRGPNPSDPLRVAAQAVHASLATTAFGPSVTYLDVSSIFVQPDGPLTPGFYVDELHLTLAGYRAWARAIDSTLQALVG